MSDIFTNNFIKYPKALFRTTIMIINNIYCIPTYVLWMTLLLPVKSYRPDIYYRIEGLFFHWIISIVAMWSWTAGYDVVELGDDIAPARKENVRTMIIANHQSTADVPLMMASFNAKPNVLPNLMWIMERLFKYTNFGIVSLIHQDFFISS
ncbi:Acyl-CoA:lysophosphatidylglycerol acyltransferase 1, partial [Pseudolycoriella hygida]